MEDESIDNPISSTDGGGDGSSGLFIFQGRVVEVFLDKEDNTSNGRIEVQILKDQSDFESNSLEDIYAFPLDINNFTLPAVNESVVIYAMENSQYFYSCIPPVNFIDQTTIDSENNPREVSAEEENLKVNLHSFDEFSVNDDVNEEVYGVTLTKEFIEATDPVVSRKVREGDTLMQSRFGSSIKFTVKNELNETPWSLDGEDGQPVIIIRNGQDREPNIATDNSFIYMLSDQSLDYGDFTPIAESSNVSDALDVYVGSQVVIGADRLTFISKADDISFSSTGIISMATPKWAVDLDVLMDQVKALAEQVAALTKGEATFTTGVGPTGPATNAADVATIVQEISGLEQ